MCLRRWRPAGGCRWAWRSSTSPTASGVARRTRGPEHPARSALTQFTSTLRPQLPQIRKRADQPAGPALVGERNDHARFHAMGPEGLLHLAVELALDHHVDQARAEPGTPAALGSR